MNTYTYRIGAFILALSMGAVPAFALAEKGSGVREMQAVRVSALASTTLRAEMQDALEAAREDKAERRGSATTSDDFASSTRMMKGEGRALMLGKLRFLLESSTTPAVSLAQLRLSIEARKHELDDEEASSTAETRDMMRNMNPVRLAVHSLLASKELLGGIGPEVSEIAQHMNDSVATTTEAEVKMQSRGFFMHLLFGGDGASADAISSAVARNQEYIQKLTDLVNQATTTAEVKAVLTAQITALQDAQARLQALASKEQKAWGLFSWRF